MTYDYGAAVVGELAVFDVRGGHELCLVVVSLSKLGREPPCSRKRPLAARIVAVNDVYAQRLDLADSHSIIFIVCGKECHLACRREEPDSHYGEHQRADGTKDRSRSSVLQQLIDCRNSHERRTYHKLGRLFEEFH